jgi:glycine cleavage system H protein
MSNIPSELRYAKTHEWAQLNEDGTVSIGISDHAQGLLGDLVYVELPEEGTEAKSGQEIGVVESVKAASDVYSPINGEVVEINEEVSANPEVVNHDPYGAGWLFKIRPEDEAELQDLLDADAYETLVDAEQH